MNNAVIQDSDLTGANLSMANLTDADLRDAVVKGANFGDTTSYGFTAAQLYSTASYKSGDLQGIGLGLNDLADGNFAGKNLRNADFGETVLTDSNLTDAVVEGANLAMPQTWVLLLHSSTARPATRAATWLGSAWKAAICRGWSFAGKDISNANFGSAVLAGADLTDAKVDGSSFAYTTDLGFTAAQLYSTAGYKSGNLAGISLEGNDLSGWDFTGQDLSGTALLDANLTDALIDRANLAYTTDLGFAAEQLYSTATYKSGDLTAIGLAGNDLSGWDFAGKNLTEASFEFATLTNTDLNHATLSSAYFGDATLTNADLSQANLSGAILSSRQADERQPESGKPQRCGLRRSHAD